MPAKQVWVNSLLFVSGVGQAFFLPLLGALALGLVGHAGLGRMMGVNQGFNHAGNLAAALSALVLVTLAGLRSGGLGLAGVVVGKALVDGRLSVKEAIAACATSG